MSNGSDIESRLGLGRHFRRRPRKVWLALAAILLAVLVAILLSWLPGGNGSSAQSYITQEATRGELSVTITATGTLEPVTKVDVSSELSGIVESVEVDFNDHVKADQELARLDPSSLKAQVIKARAAVNSAMAKINEAKATRKEANAQLQKLQNVWELSGGKVPSRREMDSAEAASGRAGAAVVTAEAQLEEAQASLTVSETSLSKTVIRSPIDGVVLNRAVEPGQTVASSLQAPVLFTIAETLTQMELHVFVDEADVGNIRQGQSATFTVDAYPDRTFEAIITEVRFTPTETEGVVTYETVLSVDNTALILRPGMTATAEVTTEHLEDVLLVPNAALRFTPQQKRQDTEDGSIVDKLLPRRHRDTKESNNNNHPRVWAITGDKTQPLREIRVKTGPSDGSVTVIREGKVEPGEKLVTGVARSGK